MSKVAQNHVHVIFLLSLRQTDEAGQRKKNEAQSSSKTCSQPSEEPARSSNLTPCGSLSSYSVPLAGGCSGSHCAELGGAAPGKRPPGTWHWHLPLTAGPCTRALQDKNGCHSAPFPLPCIQLALNKCSPGGWELGPAPWMLCGGRGRTKEPPAFCVSGCLLTFCPASGKALSTARRRPHQTCLRTKGLRQEAGTGRGAARARTPRPSRRPLAATPRAHQSASVSTSGAP